MRNTTFEMSINGIEYRIYNGTDGECVKAENLETGVKVTINESGTYANKTCVRRAILRHIEEFSRDEKVQETENGEHFSGTINDVIFRNLPKYVQNVIDYCDYVDGIYRIHVNSEYGSKEITDEKWAVASASVKNYCKTGTEM